MLSIFRSIIILLLFICFCTLNIISFISGSSEGQLLDCVNRHSINSEFGSSSSLSLCSNYTQVEEKQHTRETNLGLTHVSSKNVRETDAEVVPPLTIGGDLSAAATDQQQKSIQVYIRTPNNETKFDLGSALTIECRFNTTFKQDLKFNLRWLRSVVGSHGHNQSITTTDTDSSLTIIAATTRVWTVRRISGLDLELNDFQAGDTGNYFCQAVSSDSIISEAQIQLTLKEPPPSNDGSDVHQSSGENNGAIQQPDLGLYSQDNLSKLLPSLKVVPQFSEISTGDTVQLACITSSLDPDPEPADIDWTFESVDRSQLLLKPPIASSQLPYNVTVLGNILVVWSMSEEHCGLYKCTVNMPEFNLSTQAAGELALRPNADSAPLVFLSSELVRLSPNGSATIQCEATGYPPPELIWYRVDGSLAQQQPSGVAAVEGGGKRQQAGLSLTTTVPTTMILDTESASLNIDGIEFERIPYKDCVFYCEQNRCISSSAGRRSAQSGGSPVTGISLIHLHQAKAQHQGQYVCRANNKHGSNQASFIVDVEFKDPPVVKIADQFREQTIELRDNLTEHVNVTFRCSVESGRPQARLRWLRTSSSNSLKTVVGENNNLDIYDLTRVSSATSNVSTWLEDNEKTLVLVISTVSLDDEGDYICLGENEWGRHSAVAHLAIRKPGQVKILQSSPLLANMDDSFHLDCMASGQPIPLDIEWSRSDRGAFFSLISRSSLYGGNQERAVLKFDRVSLDESGEYTCNARDPLNSSVILRDTIMVLVEDHTHSQDATRESYKQSLSDRAQSSLLPKLMVRPTRVNAPLGSNVTLDCLAVSGLQPTIVEWIPPSSLAAISLDNSISDLTCIRPYYRTNTDSMSTQTTAIASRHQLLQFGSKLKIFNISKMHEGVYQCKGRNRLGVENAPALIRVLDAPTDGGSGNTGEGSASSPVNQTSGAQTKTKVTKVGSNIELKCQVNGLDEQPATSWSRDGLELPISSVQIGHNLWIQNVTSKDNGLYVCSARSKQPNKVIQAKINLLVRGSSADSESSKRLHSLNAKIVASKSAVNMGDSITLECIVSVQNSSAASGIDGQAAAGANEQRQQQLVKGLSSGGKSTVDLDELERSIVWTNLHSGQSLFQDNVYILNNLLIIYELRPENSATYRCNYNDLTQHVDYKLQVIDASTSSQQEGAKEPPGFLMPNSTHLTSSSLAANGMRARVELKQVSLGSHLMVECPQMKTPDTKNYSSPNYYWTREVNHQRVHQEGGKPLVFEAIQTGDADVYHCHRIESTEPAESVLIHVLVPVARFAQRPVSFITLPTISRADHQLDIELKFLPERDNGLILFNGQHSIQPSSPNSNRSVSGGGDYISLGLNKGYLEFRFELGDGTTLLRSLQPLALNQWHKVVIERNRRGAVMWLDKQLPVSNSSAGKFFNLNLDSVLYIGGNQYFLNKSRSNGGGNGKFYGYARGFQGCIGLLRIAHQELNLMARNRSAAIGIYECDKPECRATDCNQQNGVCQIDRNWLLVAGDERKTLDSTKRASSSADLRCICLPGFGGDRCDKQVPLLTSTSVEPTLEHPTQVQAHSNQNVSLNGATTTVATLLPKQSLAAPDGACETLNVSCSTNGTIKCQSLSSTSFKCHCRLGFMGDTCSQAAVFSSETSVWFNQQAYLQFRFNKPDEALAYLRSQQQESNTNITQDMQQFNSTNFTKLTSIAENQNISFRIQTKSSYGLIFYTGQSSSAGADTTNGGTPALIAQTSKSMVANLLARLSNVVFDYLAVALVDGHIELSYELGSGVAIIRSSQRVNDGETHQIRVLRNGKFARLIIDEIHKHEGNSPGKLSMLNSQSADMYLGGLPHLAELTHNMYMSGFVGCLSNLEINSLGPLNLIRSDHLSQLRSARNLAPCQSGGASDSPIKQQQQQQPVHKPYQKPPSVVAEGDDPDEM